MMSKAGFILLDIMLALVLASIISIAAMKYLISSTHALNTLSTAYTQQRELKKVEQFLQASALRYYFKGLPLIYAQSSTNARYFTSTAEARPFTPAQQIMPNSAVIHLLELRPSDIMQVRNIVSVQKLNICRQSNASIANKSAHWLALSLDGAMEITSAEINVRLIPDCAVGFRTLDNIQFVPAQFRPLNIQAQDLYQSLSLLIPIERSLVVYLDAQSTLRAFDPKLQQSQPLIYNIHGFTLEQNQLGLKEIKLTTDETDYSFIITNENYAAADYYAALL